LECDAGDAQGVDARMELMVCIHDNLADSSAESTLVLLIRFIVSALCKAADNSDRLDGRDMMW
jgi:hypothetical protein